MRLIDADALLNALNTYSDTENGNAHFLHGIKSAQEQIDDAPTIDAVRVVRCGECSHYNISGCSEGFGWCEKIDRGVTDGHFCSFGERKTEDKQ